MGAIRVARPQICRKYIHHGLTLGCLLRLTTLDDCRLVCKRSSGNSRDRRRVARQVDRAITATDSREWLVQVHRAHSAKSSDFLSLFLPKKGKQNSLNDISLKEKEHQS